MFLISTFALGLSLQGAILNPQPPIIVPGGPGHFDFMTVDADDRLAFAAHPGKNSFTVINLDDKTVKEVDAGCECNCVAADSSNHRAFAAGGGKTLVEFDITSWAKKDSAPLDGPGDSVLYDTKRNVVDVDNDDGTNLWTFDPDTLKLTATTTIKEAPEVPIMDYGRNRIYQNIKSANAIQVIDPDAHKVVAEYKLGELDSPHGLAEDFTSGKLFDVGKNGKLVVVDADSGKILATIDVVKSSDQIAYDPDLKLLYIPGAGQMDIVDCSGNKPVEKGNLPVPKGCHSVVVDPKTHNVWVDYADANNSYVMEFTRPQAKS